MTKLLVLLVVAMLVFVGCWTLPIPNDKLHAAYIQVQEATLSLDDALDFLRTATSDVDKIDAKEDVIQAVYALEDAELALQQLLVDYHNPFVGRP